MQPGLTCDPLHPQTRATSALHSSTDSQCAPALPVLFTCINTHTLTCMCTNYIQTCSAHTRACTHLPTHAHVCTGRDAPGAHMLCTMLTSTCTFAPTCAPTCMATVTGHGVCSESGAHGGFLTMGAGVRTAPKGHVLQHLHPLSQPGDRTGTRGQGPRKHSLWALPLLSSAVLTEDCVLRAEGAVEDYWGHWGPFRAPCWGLLR